MVIHCQSLRRALSFIVAAPYTCEEKADRREEARSVKEMEEMEKTEDWQPWQGVTDRIDVAPVGFSLRVLERITVDFAGASEQKASADSLRKP